MRLKFPLLHLLAALTHSISSTIADRLVSKSPLSRLQGFSVGFSRKIAFGHHRQISSTWVILECTLTIVLGYLCHATMRSDLLLNYLQISSTFSLWATVLSIPANVLQTGVQHRTVKGKRVWRLSDITKWFSACPRISSLSSRLLLHKWHSPGLGEVQLSSAG